MRRKNYITISTFLSFSLIALLSTHLHADDGGLKMLEKNLENIQAHKVHQQANKKEDALHAQKVQRIKDKK